MAKVVILAVSLLLLSSLTVLADVVPQDLSTWTAVNLNFPGGQNAANWVLSNGNTTVTQVVNADPSFYTNNADLPEYTMNGTWRVVGGSDDDFMGFTFGFADAAHCYIFDWKQNAQSVYGDAEEGMTVKKIDAPSESDLIFDDFWDSDGTDHTTILGSNWGSSAGYSDNTLYTFNLTVNVGSFTILVLEETTVLWEITINDGNYTGGQFGFYNNSQGNVEYSGFTLNVPPVCAAGGPYLGDAGAPVQFDGSNCFDEDGEIVLWEWDFGDGTTGVGVAATHTYAEDGLYDVTLCVTDNEGLVRCCAATEAAVPTDETTWGGLKALYR